MKWNSTSIGVLILCLINIIVHIAFFEKLEYHRDELLYFSIGLHPQFGYASIPPLTGWIATILQFLFGFTLFSIKIFPALLSGIFTLVPILIAKELGGKSYAQLLTGTAILIMPVTLRAFHLFQPVCIDLFFWTLIIYYTIRYVNSEKEKYFTYIGIASGFALLNKYLVLLLLIALFCSIALTDHKKIFYKRSFYFGLAICIVMVSPNVIWQFFNGLPVINHISELNESQLINVNRINFIKDQFLMTFATSFVIFIGFVGLVKNRKFNYLAISTFIVFAILIVLRGKSYYSIGMIPLLVAAGAVSIEKSSFSNFIKLVLPFAMIIITIPFIPLGIPLYKEEGMVNYFQKLEIDYGLILGRRFEDGSIHSLPQDYADQLGWEELTEITSKAFEQIEDKQKCMIYCENYGQAGAISIIGKKYNLPEPVSFGDSFIYWIPKDLKHDIESFIYINDELGEDIQELFQDIKIIGQVSNPNAREYGTTVYLCNSPNYSFNLFWNSVLDRVLH